VGAQGPAGLAGSVGAQGPAGAQGPRGLPGGEDTSVAFVGYTSTGFTGSLDGRSGAHARCGASFPGSHFCATWELDQSSAPAVAATAWVDAGNSDASSRFFREPLSTTPGTGNTCTGWTSGSASQRGLIVTSLGEVKTSFVANGDEGCQTARPLACCMGGTAVQFRGFTSPRTASLGGRSGAHAVCDATFSGSHFCTDWEVDQAAVPAPIPQPGAWVDPGISDTRSRLYRPALSTLENQSSCLGWTSASPTLHDARGLVLTPLGGFTRSFVAIGDGGCGHARPLACCDGSPPE